MSNKRSLMSGGRCPARKSVISSDVGWSEDMHSIQEVERLTSTHALMNQQAQGSKLQGSSLQVEGRG